MIRPTDGAASLWTEVSRFLRPQVEGTMRSPSPSDISRERERAVGLFWMSLEALSLFRSAGRGQRACRVAEGYKLHEITGDNYSAEWAVSAYKDSGIKYTRSEKTKSALYLEARRCLLAEASRFRITRFYCGSCACLSGGFIAQGGTRSITADQAATITRMPCWHALRDDGARVIASRSTGFAPTGS